MGSPTCALQRGILTQRGPALAYQGFSRPASPHMAAQGTPAVGPIEQEVGPRRPRPPRRTMGASGPHHRHPVKARHPTGIPIAQLQTHQTASQPKERGGCTTAQQVTQLAEYGRCTTAQLAGCSGYATTQLAVSQRCTTTQLVYRQLASSGARAVASGPCAAAFGAATTGSDPFSGGAAAAGAEAGAARKEGAEGREEHSWERSASGSW